MAELEQYGLLMDAFRIHYEYPGNLISEPLPKNVRIEYQNYLEKRGHLLFESTGRHKIWFWEAWVGEYGETQSTSASLTIWWCSLGLTVSSEYASTDMVSFDNVTRHLLQNRVDPRCRHIFIEAANSRAPLNCTHRILSAILTYHQVHYCYLDFIFAFGDQTESTDAGLAQFQFDDSVFLGTPKPAIPQLDRSGCEIRHAFLLRAPERLVRPGSGPWPWSIRQVAVYHSFDIKSRKSLWITIKANSLLRDRVRDDTQDIPLLRADAKGDLTTQWEAALATHMIYFRYVEENWRWVVREMEDLIRKRLARAKTTPVASPIPLSSMLTTKNKVGTGLSTRIRKGAAKKKWLSKLLPPFFPPDLNLNDLQNERRGAIHAGASEGMRKLDVFNYKDLQSLNVTKGHIEELSLVIKLNLKALKDIRDYFEQLEHHGLVKSEHKEPLANSKREDPLAKPECKDPADDERQAITRVTSQFLLRLDRIMRSLETREIQLQSLGRQLEEGTALLGTLLTFRGLDISQFFVEQAHVSGESMHKIAVETRRETVSMHIITMMTLIFLPGTFIATFFQSGIFQWSENMDFVGDWHVRNDALGLFFEIAVPVTALVLAVWYMAFRRAKRANQHNVPGFDQSTLSELEKQADLLERSTYMDSLCDHGGNPG